MPYMIIKMQLAEGIEYIKFYNFTKALNNAIYDCSDAVSWRSRIYQTLGIYKGT